MLQPPYTDATGAPAELMKSRFARIFCTEPEGPVSPLVLREERLRELAGEMAKHSPGLVSLLVSAGDR